MPSPNPEQARFNMVAQQIRPWDVFEHRVLDLFATLPREKFVPAAFQRLAFADIEVPLEHGENMMAPRVEARLLQSLALDSDDRVLEIGTGSGFLCACLARLARQVESIDIHGDFVDAAAGRLGELDIDNVTLRRADALAEAWTPATYDVIAVTGSLAERSPALEQALKVGGRMFVVLGRPPVMSACVVRRLGDDEFAVDPQFETLLTPLRNAPSGVRFRF